MGPELSADRFRQLNGDVSLVDELKREDDVAKTVLTVGLAGALAASSVAAAANVGDYAVAFAVAAVALVLSSGTGLFSLSIAAIRRSEKESSPWVVLGQKRGLNRCGLAGIFLALVLGLLTAGEIALDVL